MKYLFLILVFLHSACHNTHNSVFPEIIKSIPDSTNGFYARQFYDEYKQTRKIEQKLSLADISNGTKKIELRYWNLSSSYDPQSIYILKRDESDEWELRVIRYYHSRGDSITSETNMKFRNDIIEYLDLPRYWNLNSQSEISNGDSYGCMDGGTVLLEMSDSSRYKYILFRCPEMHVNKDSSFYLINKLSSDLRSLAKEQ